LTPIDLTEIFTVAWTSTVIQFPSCLKRNLIIDSYDFSAAPGRHILLTGSRINLPTLGAICDGRFGDGKTGQMCVRRLGPRSQTVVTGEQIHVLKYRRLSAT